MDPPRHIADTVPRMAAMMLPTIPPPEYMRADIAACLAAVKRAEYLKEHEAAAFLKQEPLWSKLIALAPFAPGVRVMVNRISPNTITDQQVFDAIAAACPERVRERHCRGVQLTDAEVQGARQAGAAGRDKADAAIRHYEHVAGLYSRAGNELQAAVFAGMAAEARKARGGLVETRNRTSRRFTGTKGQ